MSTLSPPSRAYTLIETLLALAILGMISAALVVWMRAETTAIDRASAYEQDGTIERWVRVLRDDLYSATSAEFDPEASCSPLTMRTCHNLPGEQPGWHEVTWRSSDDDSGLLRIRAGTPRRVPLPGARLLQLESEQQNADSPPDTTALLLWLELEHDDRIFVGPMPSGEDQ